MKFEKKLASFELLDCVKIAIIATRSIQDDKMFQKWSYCWLENIDRTTESAEKLSNWFSPAGKCANAVINYNKSLIEPRDEYKKLYERLCRQYCEDTVLATYEKWRLSLDLEEFFPELQNYPETGPKPISLKFNKFKISRKERELKMKEAGYRCEICGIEYDDAKMTKNFGLQIDHNHATETFRGVLCGPCNRMIGLAQDNPDILKKGAKYVQTRQ